MQIDSQKPVLVTGATGYVAGWVVKRLLEKGLTVRATVRDPSNEGRLAYLRALAEGTKGTIEFFGADLLEKGSFDEAMQGCGVVLHIASPYIASVKDPQRELIDPALNGTRNVLEAVNRTESVTRVVLTSSCAAIFGSSADLANTPNGVFNEEVWNTTSSLTDGAYSYSKTLAEREAWKIHDAQSRWRLVVVNPPGVFGPGIRMHENAESFRILTSFVDGTFASGVPDIRIGFVDVRDVAEAHLRAAFLPNASGRNIISGHNSGFVELAGLVKREFPAIRVSDRKLPKWLLWLVGPILNSALTRRFISRNVGHPWRADNRKSIEELGMTYRPLDETFRDHIEQLMKSGSIKAAA
ncbi:MAG: aldehyde reductase [Myxococcota bacterium]